MRASRHIRATPVIGTLLVILALVALGVFEASRGSGPSTANANAATSPTLDPGSPLSGLAPDFTLTDQFDRRVSLHSFRGRVVLLAFNDSECTTVCPLTTTAMVAAKRMLGAAGSKVALLGVDANPTATAVRYVRSYSEVHGMTHLWHFATGPLPQLKRVWHAYHIDVAIEQGQIDHTPALFAISPQGRLERLYLTQMSYDSIDQQAQVLADEASRLLPGHPRVDSRLSYTPVPTVTPTQQVRVPRAGGGSVEFGPGSPRLLLFFASWDQQVTDLSHQLEALSGYARRAPGAGLPQLTAVDEASVEPSPSALTGLLTRLPTPPAYPVAIDTSGRLADGYGVQDEPWLVLVSATGRPLWYYDVSTQGWLSDAALVRQLRAALTRAAAAVTPKSVQSDLSGSPAPLAGLHSQASQLIGNEAALATRLKSLRGYPVVLNIWGSWCVPCQAEFGLFGSASARYGKRVAFLGADFNDSSSDARAFLAQHPVSYPSYAVSVDDLGSLLPYGLQGTPTTVYYNRDGTIVHVHTGQYDVQGSLNADVRNYALGG